jgi:hypothetical protein
MTAERRGGPAPDLAELVRRVALDREQRDWISAAAGALEQHAKHDEDPLAMLEAAAELRGVVAGWDAAGRSAALEPGPQPLREALRRIADAESGVWGRIARAALDDDAALADGGRNGHTRPLEIPGAAVAPRAGSQRARTRR